MTTRMDRVRGSEPRLDASGVGYIAFATANPALFSLMFSTAIRTPDAATTPLAVARRRAYAVLQVAADANARSGKATAAECVRLWAVVHGIAKLILEDCIRPADFGLPDGEALAAHLLQRRS